MLQISEIVKKTEEMFDLFNEHFYNKELTRPAITVSPDGGRGAYGWCSIHEIWNADNKKYREINLCAEYLDRPMTELAATFFHEMSHLYNLQQGVQDVSNNGYYHNMKFKATAEAHGLHIEKHAKYGWTDTTLTPESETWITAILGESGIHASRLQAMGSSKGGSKKSINRSIKYVCPCCGTIIRATREVNVTCADCGEPFDYAPGVLPETFPEPRAKVTRTAKAAAKAKKETAPEVEATDTPAQKETALAIIPETPATFQPAESKETSAKPETAESTTEPAAEATRACQGYRTRQRIQYHGDRLQCNRPPQERACICSRHIHWRGSGYSGRIPKITAKKFSRHNSEMILFSGYCFAPLSPAMGCSSARAMRLLSAKYLSFHGNLKRQDKN